MVELTLEQAPLQVSLIVLRPSYQCREELPELLGSLFGVLVLPKVHVQVAHEGLPGFLLQPMVIGLLGASL